MPSEKRQFSRHSFGEQACEIEFRGHRVPGIVLNVSINGFGITGIETDALKYGEAIDVVYQDETVRCICCSAQRMPNGAIKLGVQQSGLSEPTAQHLICPFIDCGGCEVACRITSRTDTLCQVELLNGKSFEVPPNCVKSLTLGERAVALQNESQLKMMANFYSIAASTEMADQREIILGIEFGHEALTAY